jgi:hypothetical protein
MIPPSALDERTLRILKNSSDSTRRDRMSLTLVTKEALLEGHNVGAPWLQKQIHLFIMSIMNALLARIESTG